MFDIVDHETKGFTSNIFVWKVIGALYIKEKFCVFLLDVMNEVYEKINSRDIILY